MNWIKIKDFNHLKGLCKYTKKEWAHICGTKLAFSPVAPPESLSETERSLVWKCVNPYQLKYLNLWVQVEEDGRIIAVAWTEGGIEL